MRKLLIAIVIGIASWYSTEACRYNVEPATCPMANGESLYEAERKEREEGEYFLASWNYDLGTRIKISHSDSRRTIQAIVKDRGPSRRIRPRRDLDLSARAFQEVCGDLRKGLCRVQVKEVL